MLILDVSHSVLKRAEPTDVAASFTKAFATSTSNWVA